MEISASEKRCGGNLSYIPRAQVLTVLQIRHSRKRAITMQNPKRPEKCKIPNAPIECNLCYILSTQPYKSTSYPLFSKFSDLILRQAPSCWKALEEFISVTYLILKQASVEQSFGHMASHSIALCVYVELPRN